MNILIDPAVIESFEDYDNSKKSFEEFILELTTSLRDVIENGYHETGNLRLQADEQTREATENLLKAWDKAEKAGFWGKLAKFFGYAIVALTMITPLVCLTPLTAAMALTTLVMLSASPLIDKAFAKLAEELGPVAGPIVGLIIMAALLLVVCRGSASAISKMSTKAMTMESAASAIAKIKTAFLKATNGGLSAKQMNAVQAFCEKLNYSMLGAQSSAQMTTSVFRFESQMLMAETELDKFDVQEISALIELLLEDTKMNEQQRQALDSLLNTIYTPDSKF